MGIGAISYSGQYYQNYSVQANEINVKETSFEKYFLNYSADDSLSNRTAEKIGFNDFRQTLFEKLKLESLGSQEKIQKKSAVELVSGDQYVPKDKTETIGLTSFPTSPTTSQGILAQYVKDSDPNDPVVQIAYGQGNERKVYHIHVNDVDTSNASDMEMFALLSYEGHKGNKVPNAINNYSAYKTMKANAGLNISSISENNFVNEKNDAVKILQSVYDFMREGKTSEEKKNADICDYLLKLIKNRSDLYGER